MPNRRKRDALPTTARHPGRHRSPAAPRHRQPRLQRRRHGWAGSNSICSHGGTTRSRRMARAVPPPAKDGDRISSDLPQASRQDPDGFHSASRGNRAPAVKR